MARTESHFRGECRNISLHMYVCLNSAIQSMNFKMKKKDESDPYIKQSCKIDIYDSICVFYNTKCCHVVNSEKGSIN